MRLKAVGLAQGPLVTEQAANPGDLQDMRLLAGGEKARQGYADQPRLQQCQIPDDPVEAVEIQGQGCPLYLVALQQTGPLADQPASWA